MLVLVQLSTVVFGAFVIFTAGAAMFCVIVLFAVAVQPFDPVTVTVYVPLVDTEMDACVPRFVVPVAQE